jgi:hypothetical protein
MHVCAHVYVFSFSNLTSENAQYTSAIEEPPEGLINVINFLKYKL